MADIAFFLGSMNQDLEQRQTIVVGGSYPGALSAWFRAKYPHMAIASWASSAVVQPIVDFWQYDEQVYTSTLKSGSWCPEAIALTNAFVTEQAALRLNGMDNWISEVLKGTPAETMRTDDFMSFYADIPAGSVQYGNRIALCDTMQPYIGQPQL
jgi:pimeloyl-ACP methyl ester carboxylesterase